MKKYLYLILILLSFSKVSFADSCTATYDGYTLDIPQLGVYSESTSNYDYYSVRMNLIEGRIPHFIRTVFEVDSYSPVSIPSNWRCTALLSNYGIVNLMVVTPTGSIYEISLRKESQVFVVSKFRHVNYDRSPVFPDNPWNRYQ